MQPNLRIMTRRKRRGLLSLKLRSQARIFKMSVPLSSDLLSLFAQNVGVPVYDHQTNWPVKSPGCCREGRGHMVPILEHFLYLLNRVWPILVWWLRHWYTECPAKTLGCYFQGQNWPFVSYLLNCWTFIRFESSKECCPFFWTAEAFTTKLGMLVCISSVGGMSLKDVGYYLPFTRSRSQWGSNLQQMIAQYMSKCWTICVRTWCAGSTPGY